MEYEKLNCPICHKKVTVKKWTARKGILKGETIVSKIMCSPRCRRQFKLIIAFNDVMEALDRNAKPSSK